MVLQWTTLRYVYVFLCAPCGVRQLSAWNDTDLASFSLHLLLFLIVYRARLILLCSTAAGCYLSRH